MKNEEVCTTFDSYMKKLCHSELMISWIITLSDSTKVFGDYDRPNYLNPWERLSRHCKKTGLFPVKAELYMFGAEHKVFFEDPNGLDGLCILRGLAKEQSMDGSHSQSFQTLTVLLLDESCDYINVAKYTWPENKFEKKESLRGLAFKNLQHMVFKNGSEKTKHEKVQQHLNGSRV